MKRAGVFALVLLVAAGFAAVAALRTFGAGQPAGSPVTAAGGATTSAAPAAGGVTTSAAPATTSAAPAAGGATTSAVSATATAGTTPARTTSSQTSGARLSRRQQAFPMAGHLTGNKVAVRSKPSPHGKVIKVLHYFRPDYRPQEVLAVAKKVGTDHRFWYRINVPERPNGRYGWIPAGAVKVRSTAVRIVIHVKARTIDVYRRGKHVLHATVAVGARGMETPLGHFYVTARFVPYHDPFLGVFGLETSAYSKLSEWPGGGVVGIHGTNMPQLLGKAVSHGCVRVSNATAKGLQRYVPVGTPILIKS